MTKLVYPFEFQEVLLTHGLLDAMGFTEYWGGASECGDRRLHLGNEQHPTYIIWEIDENEDDTYGYGNWPANFSPCHYADSTFQKTLYFLHDMYEDILTKRTEDDVKSFINICKKTNLYPALESYIKYKQTLQ